MKPLEVRRYLFDIVQACELLEEFTRGKTFEDYCCEPMLRSAVERQFEVIGEALAAVVRLDSSITTEIADTPRMIAFRNRLIHGYSTVSDEVVWGVLESHLTRLRAQATELLGEPAPE